VTLRAHFAIIGAGMAGASLAAAISGRASAVLIEAEDQPGYHSTGRSAAFWAESYGGSAVQPLTSASGPVLQEGGFLRARGGLHIAEAGGEAALAAMEREFGGAVELKRLGRAELETRLPGLREGWNAGLFEPSCADIDVAALHAHYLATARRSGVELLTRARLLEAERTNRGWRLATSSGAVEAGVLVNAAGAWADRVAELAGVRPIGIRAYRRTIAQLRVAPPAPADLPLVIDAQGRFYFKPEAGGRLWLSPHDETPCDPGDCAAEELDVALAIDRLERAVDWPVERVERRWAGLRSFAPDRVPVYGFASDRQDFFWFAGQGGFGIQTAPAAAALGAALLLSTAPPPEVARIDAAPYRPGRLLTS
jgi:D-arginine dehydrogenase